MDKPIPLSAPGAPETKASPLPAYASQAGLTENFHPGKHLPFGSEFFKNPSVTC
jgi:hypothetical protein